MAKRVGISVSVLFSVLLASQVQAATILGTIVDASPFNDASIVTFMNIFLGLSNPSGPSVIGTETYTRNGSADPGTGVVTTLDMADAGDFNSIGYFPGGYEYMLAKYDGTSGFGVVYYLGNQYVNSSLSVPLTANNGGGSKDLTGWKVFNNVPDGGSTAILLGSVLVVFGIARRRFEH